MNRAGKILAGMLAIYMLALMFLPCNDDCDSHQHTAQISCFSTLEHHQQDNDICSPVCSCSCCSTFVTLIHPAEINTVVKTAAGFFSLINQSIVSVYSGDCWQPPRIA